MPRKKLFRNAPCPCDSGKKYKHCCYGRDFIYLKDGEGNILKSIPITDEMGEVIEEQKRKFTEKYGREPGPGDNLFYDTPPLEHVEHVMVEVIKQAGLDSAIIYAFAKTGFCVTVANQHLISDKARAEWEAAILEYHAKRWFWSTEPSTVVKRVQSLHSMKLLGLGIGPFSGWNWLQVLPKNSIRQLYQATV